MTKPALTKSHKSFGEMENTLTDDIVLNEYSKKWRYYPVQVTSFPVFMFIRNYLTTSGVVYKSVSALKYLRMLNTAAKLRTKNNLKPKWLMATQSHNEDDHRNKLIYTVATRSTKNWPP